jgi:hypothetical protein
MGPLDDSRDRALHPLLEHAEKSGAPLLAALAAGAPRPQRAAPRPSGSRLGRRPGGTPSLRFPVGWRLGTRVPGRAREPRTHHGAFELGETVVQGRGPGRSEIAPDHSFGRRPRAPRRDGGTGVRLDRRSIVPEERSHAVTDRLQAVAPPTVEVRRLLADKDAVGRFSAVALERTATSVSRSS